MLNKSANTLTSTKRVPQYSVVKVRESVRAWDTIGCIEQNVPDPINIDLSKLGISGNTVCVWVHDQGLDVPIIILNARSQGELQDRMLDSGHDDYIAALFSSAEFAAHVRAIIHRAGPSEITLGEAKVNIEGLTINLKSRRAFVDDVDMHLTRTEFALLATLARNCDAVLTHDELLVEVWGPEYRGSSHYLHVYLGRLRKKLSSKYSSLLENVAGIGYLFHSSLPG